jgi:hypothetical protein
VRSFDKRFIKPILLREKFKSQDEQLLNTFKKINELNLNKMAENPQFSMQNNSKETVDEIKYKY